MGQLTLELPKTLQHNLEQRAKEEGVSLQQYIVYALTQQVGQSYNIRVLPPEQIQEQRAQYEELLASLGQPSIEATRAFLAEREPAEPEAELSPETIERFKAQLATAREATA
ncbi:MAG: toxin-antitoxin system HicB family antitoxin [Chloroflexi bacterium]|nr:toxin-antitoxin system HicB family antitoxin [Chloroflexota bacterium]